MQARIAVKLILRDLGQREGLRITPRLIDELDERWQEMLSDAEELEGITEGDIE